MTPSRRASRGSGWRARVILAVIALVVAASVSPVWHGELVDEDECCVLCCVREHSVADLAASVQLQPFISSAPVGPPRRHIWTAVDPGYQIPPRAPPA